MSQSKSAEWMKHWSKVVERAWHDEGFKKRLLSNPAAVLKEEGIEPPQGVQVKLVENTQNVIHLTLPAKVAGELSEKDLELVAAGGKVGGRLWGGTHVF
jgi:hypothetical protein